MIPYKSHFLLFGKMVSGQKDQKYADDKAVSLISRDERGLKATPCRIGRVNGNKRNSVFLVV